MRRWPDHFHHLSRYVVAALSDDLDLHLLTRYAPEHKDRLIPQVSQRLAKSSHSFKFKAQ